MSGAEVLRGAGGHHILHLSCSWPVLIPHSWGRPGRVRALEFRGTRCLSVLTRSPVSFMISWVGGMCSAPSPLPSILLIQATSGLVSSPQSPPPSESSSTSSTDHLSVWLPPPLSQQVFSDGIVRRALPATLALVDALLSEYRFQKMSFFLKIGLFLWIYFSLSLSHSFSSDVCFKV